MIIVKLQGGLGNQMFQYAAGRALALRHQTELKFDLTHLLDRSPKLKIVFRDYDLDIFPNIHVPSASDQEVDSIKKRLFNSVALTKVIGSVTGNIFYFKEKPYNFNSRFNDLQSNVYLDGYWQSEGYFNSIKGTIKEDFSLPPFSVAENPLLAEQISSRTSVCLNIRRGDFVSHPGSSSFHGFTGLKYVEKAVKFIEQRASNLHFYIFSDDIEWCRHNINLQHASTIVDHRHAGKKFADYLQLMCGCKHFIIPNSSFAWWAAWLNNDPEKIVVAPQRWFNDPSIDTSDLIPETWIRI